MKDHQGRQMPNSAPTENFDENHHLMTPSSQHGLLADPQPISTERLTLDKGSLNPDIAYVGIA